jgi:hypothetical protein
MAAFTYDLTKDITDSIQQSGDAVVLVIPYDVEDSFSFADGQSAPMIISGPNILSDIDAAMKSSTPFLLDSMVINLAVQHTKDKYHGSLTANLVDPNHNLLSLLNPGDWMVCWMFNNSVDADKLRRAFENGIKGAVNGFNSGLKFVGKIHSARMQKVVGPDGNFFKRITLAAMSFSELGSAIYYDPLLTHNFKQLEFITNVNEAVNQNFSGNRRNVSETVTSLLSAFLGNPPSMSTGPNHNVPLRIPTEIATILGKRSAKSFLDILTAYIGTQKYSNSYIPSGLSAAPFAQNFYDTSDPLLGYVYPFIAPFNNVPIWSAVQQNSVPALNEMYTTLRANKDNLVMPHVVIRQIPLNTDSFVQKNSVPCTAFRELPRWKVDDTVITQYDTGKSDAMRINFVQIQPANSFSNKTEYEALARSSFVPRWDEVDIQRNGLHPFISQIYTSDMIDALELGQTWNDMVTDRLVGGHLKLSGSMGLVGIQEPIAVGDNLEYDKLLYHIESVTHTLTVNPQSGAKSFSSQLALSHGVPAAGPVLPEVATRTFKKVQTTPDAEPALGISSTTTVRHSATPSTNIQSEND